MYTKTQNSNTFFSFFRFKTYIPWLFIPFASISYELVPELLKEMLSSYYEQVRNFTMPDDLYIQISNNFNAFLSLQGIRELFKYVDLTSQTMCALIIVIIGYRYRLYLKLPDYSSFLTFSHKSTTVTNINEVTNQELRKRESVLTEVTNQELRKCESVLKEIKKNVSIIEEIKQMLSEQLESYLKESKKSEQEIKDHLKKTFQNQIDVKFENLEIELKKNQKEQFADLKNQQKLFLTKQQNNPQKAEFLEQKFTEIKEKTKENFDDQNSMLEKQNEDLKKQLSQIKTSINNQTRQQGILQNLVLDLKNSDDMSDQARAQENESDETSRQCIICMDNDLCVALRPCGHIVACEGCVGKLTRKCPTCRETIIGTLKIYLP